MTSSATRVAIVAGAAGLAGGLVLGISSLSVAEQAPPPSPGTAQDERWGKRFLDERGFGHRFGGPGRPFGKHRGAGGLVQSVSSSSITVLAREGARTIALNSDTSYYVGATKATRSAVREGVVVGIRLVDPRSDKPVAAVVTVVPARIAGWVTAVEGSTITVTDLSGFTRAIRTDGSTVYVKDGSTATRSIVVKGALIRATGEVADDGTTLHADRIAVGHRDRPDDAPPGPST